MITLKLDAKPWRPRDYQIRAAKALTTMTVAALFPKPGSGKTSIVLSAFKQMREQGLARRMLIVAPLWPAKYTWPGEITKWTDFAGLSYIVLHGSAKDKNLHKAKQADITIVNYEGLQWLVGMRPGSLPEFDIIVFDELTKVKNSSGMRHRAARKLAATCVYKWGLTGTPIPNGHEDLFGQMLVLDAGNCFGKYKTKFTARYYRPNPHKPWEQVLIPGAAEDIEAKISSYVINTRADEKVPAPEPVDIVHTIPMPKAVREHYNKLKRTALLELETTTITATNKAAVYSKLAQLANGAIYDKTGQYIVVHDAKLQELQKLQKELSDEQILVAYEFRHDLDRIQALFPEAETIRSDLPAAQVRSTFHKWNNGSLKMLVASPASIGHGVNIQHSSACHIVWFSPIWDLELYDQFIARLARSGNAAPCIYNHIFVLENSIDDKLKLPALAAKDTSQERMLDALQEEVYSSIQLQQGERPMSNGEYSYGPRPTPGPSNGVPTRPLASTRGNFEETHDTQRDMIRSVATGGGFSEEVMARAQEIMRRPNAESAAARQDLEEMQRVRDELQNRALNDLKRLEQVQQARTQPSYPQHEDSWAAEVNQTQGFSQAQPAVKRPPGRPRKQEDMPPSAPINRLNEGNIALEVTKNSGLDDKAGMRLEAIVSMFKDAVAAVMSVK